MADSSFKYTLITKTYTIDIEDIAYSWDLTAKLEEYIT